MRGTVISEQDVQEAPGITPAHAGNSNNGMDYRCSNWDHPRACGEQTKKIPYFRTAEPHSMPFSFSLQ